MRWSVVIPVYNEAGFLARTIASLIGQSAPFHLVIVDNGSDDGCIAAARRQLHNHTGPVTFLNESRAGQVYALRAGISAAASEFTAICDADTYYPPHYLATATRIFDTRGTTCVAVCAYLRRGRGVAAWASKIHRLAAATLWPHQNHTSGAAQMFRTADLKAVGGYDPDRWPYVLKDHELMHRVLQRGHQAYHPDLWCVSSDRRADRSAVRWTLSERIRYHLTPARRQDAFFYGFLAKRFEARGQRDTVLRQRQWAI